MAVKPCGFERLLRKVAFTRETCVVGIRGFVFRELSIQLFPDLQAFWSLEKNALHENCLSRTLLMFQLTRNSPSSSYIS